VNNNPANPVINVRAWGETPQTASDLAAAFTRGVQATGVLACAKHFPGHGDTSTDSHLDLPVIGHNLERLDTIELPPFQAVIAEGVAAVMTAHLMLSALDPERPATLSRPVLSGLLRQELGFDGLIVTDALVMEAIAGRYGAGEAAVLALEAGADLVLMPADARGALAAIEAAVAAGRLSESQLRRSAERRREALAQTTTPSAKAPEAMHQPERAMEPDGALALELVQATLQVQGAPWIPSGGGVNLVRCDNALSAPFLPLTAPALVIPEAAGLATCLIEAHSPSPWSGDPQAPLALDRLPDGPVLLQLFVRGNPFRGSAGAGEPWAEVIRQLQAAHRLAGVVVYGSPYLWQSLQPALHAGASAAYSPGQMPLAQQKVLDAIITSKQPSPTGFTD
jgi:beta-glucosidase